MRRAVFFDRDGTLIESVHYLSRPEQVKLLDGAVETLKRVRDLGFLCFVVTNQAAVGKGVITVSDLMEIHEYFERLLGEAGARLDGWYYCTEVLQGTDREIVEHPDRKPGPGMLLRAAREHELDLGRSWMVGDMVSDVLAGRNAGCKKTVLLRSSSTTIDDEAHDAVDYIVDSIRDVGDLIRQEEEEDRQ